MESISTPRVNQQYLDSFTNQTVRVVGKVVQLRGEEATVDANGMVTCFLTRVSKRLIFTFLGAPDQIEERRARLRQLTPQECVLLVEAVLRRS